MTGFASGRGELGAHSWAWELRGVNAKGLDLRLRVPDWLDGLETALRTDLGKAVKRGNVTLTLRVARGDEQGAVSLNTAALSSVLDALAQVQTHATDKGVTLREASASDILAMRGVLETGTSDDDPAPLVAQLRTEATSLIAAFVEMRNAEGANLATVLHSQLAQIETLTSDAARLAADRKDVTARNLRTNLARVLDNSDSADPARVAQELAMIAVKADVTEEIDRLTAHVTAARDLLAGDAPVGRKLDFLMQEFNREANTLCSKSQSTDLTATGLELKAVIDQMREQVQNVE